MKTKCMSVFDYVYVGRRTERERGGGGGLWWCVSVSAFFVSSDVASGLSVVIASLPCTPAHTGECTLAG